MSGQGSSDRGCRGGHGTDDCDGGGGDGRAPVVVS